MKALLDALRQQLTPLFDEELHALAGLAGGAYGFTTGNWRDMLAGLSYAVLVKLAAAVKAAAQAKVAAASTSSPGTTMKAGA